tara:strand:- start:3774 stop:4022 length:249 start_codon:yes stop_codon:yes gene_type:complete
MSQDSKITQEELAKVTELNSKMVQIQGEIGAGELRKADLVAMFAKESEQMEVIKKELEETYGKVNIDLKDGSYELIPEEEKE